MLVILKSLVKRYCFLFTSLSLFCCTYVDGAVIEVVSGPAQGDPGGVVTIIFKIEETRYTRVDVDFPEGWTPLFPLNEAFSQINLCLLPIKIPQNTVPGTYFVNLKVNDTTKAIPITVQTKREICFEWKDPPCLLAEGQDIALPLKCINKGNAPSSLKVIVEIDKEGSAWCEENEIVLQATDTHICIGHYTISPTSLHNRRRVLQVKVIDIETGEEVFCRCAVVETLPCGVDEPVDPWLRIRGFSRGFVAGTEGKYIGGFECYGKGFIDEWGWRELEYQILLPSDNQTNLYNEYQRLYLGIRDPEFEFILGDTNYSLTPLTERSRYGRGIGVELMQGPWNVGSYYAQNPIHHRYQLEESGAFAIYEYKPGANVSVNYILRNEKDTPTGSIVSGMTENIQDDGYIGLEYAFDTAQKHHDGDRNAFGITIRKQFFEDSWMYLEKIYAGRGFYGYYNDADYYSAGLDIGLNCNWRIALSTNRVKENFDDCETSAPRWRQFSAKLICMAFPCWQIALTGFMLRSRDAFDTTCNNFSQVWGGMQYTYANGKYAFFGNSEVGGQKDYVRNTICKPLQRHNFDFNWAFTPERLLTVHCEFGNTNYFDTRPWRYSSGAGFLWRYACSSFAELQFRAINDTFHGDHRRRYSGKYVHSIARLSHTFANAHHLGVRFDGFFSKHPDHRDQFEFLISYTIPTHTPVKWREDFGALEGYLLEEETAEPIANAVVKVGDEKRLTDKDGRYHFSNLQPGLRQINVELLPKKLIPADRENTSACIKGGRTNYYPLAALQGGSIEGVIKLFDYVERVVLQENSKIGFEVGLEEGSGLSNARIILISEGFGELISTTSDCLGRFLFESLRPGKWCLRIYPKDKLKTHTLEFEELTVYVSNKEKVVLEVKGMPARREIRPMSN